jgi:hypothetical protein
MDSCRFTRPVTRPTDAVIIRVLRASVPREDRARLVAYLRDPVLVQSPGVPGLVSFHAGLRDAPERTDFAFVGVWDDVDTLAGALGDLRHPAWLDKAGVAVTVERAELYELTGRAYPGFGSLDGEVLRIFSARIGAMGEAAFHERLRQRQDEITSEGALRAFYVGRRVRTAGTEIVAIAIWRDWESLRRLGGREGGPAAAADTSEWILEPHLETFAALEVEGEPLEA